MMDEFTGPGAPVSQAGFNAALNALGAAPEALWAVLSVETSGCGYLPDRRPKILFERHYFHNLTGGQYDGVDPDVSQPTSGGYGASGVHQYVRLAAAIQLDRQAALQSASWGLGQIMGKNFSAAGFPDVETMVRSFVASEDQQLAGMAAFVAGSPMKHALQSQAWQTFARLYNGPNYAANNYDGHLGSYYARFKSNGCPDLEVREAQIYLNYLGYDTGGIDGVNGGHTTNALRQFQQKAGINPADGSLTAATLAALEAS
jgi:hypothetical protein